MRKVLIIDHHSFFVDGLELSLSNLLENAVISCVSNLKQAKRILQVDSGIDLIFFEPDLAATSGCDIPRLLIHLTRHAPVVVVTERLDHGRLHSLMESGASAYLEKHSAKLYLQTCLQSLKQGTHYLPETVMHSLQHYRNTVLLEYQKVSSKLTSRQKEVLLLLAHGYSNQDISTCLKITESTVKSHVSKLMHIFDADNRSSCVAEAKQMGIL